MKKGYNPLIQCEHQREDLHMNMKKDVVANVLEKVARATAKATADTRCVYFHHQPKMPADIKKLNK